MIWFEYNLLPFYLIYYHYSMLVQFNWTLTSGLMIKFRIHPEFALIMLEMRVDLVSVLLINYFMMDRKNRIRSYSISIVRTSRWQCHCISILFWTPVFIQYIFYLLDWCMISFRVNPTSNCKECSRIRTIKWNWKVKIPQTFFSVLQFP